MLCDKVDGWPSVSLTAIQTSHRRRGRAKGRFLALPVLGTNLLGLGMEGKVMPSRNGDSIAKRSRELCQQSEQLIRQSEQLCSRAKELADEFHANTIANCRDSLNSAMRRQSK